MRIYIESTIPSYIVARPSRDSIKAMRQQLTKDWWEFKRHSHELFTSQVALNEIADGEKAMAVRRLETMSGIPLLELTGEAKSFANEILNSRILPAKADGDAAHIALATVHKMDILLSWNFRHITNVAIELRLRRLVEEFGFVLPVLRTPDDLIGEL
jgi:hypothetical protein